MITYTLLFFRSSTKPRLSPSSFSIFLADFTSRMNPPSPFSHTPSVRHLSSSNDRFCHVSYVEPSFDFLSTNTHAEELGTEVSNSRAVRLMEHLVRALLCTLTSLRPCRKAPGATKPSDPSGLSLLSSTVGNGNKYASWSLSVFVEEAGIQTGSGVHRARPFPFSRFSLACLRGPLPHQRTDQPCRAEQIASLGQLRSSCTRSCCGRG